jgi:hypothetical protein
MVDEICRHVDNTHIVIVDNDEASETWTFLVGAPIELLNIIPWGGLSPTGRVVYVVTLGEAANEQECRRSEIYAWISTSYYMDDDMKRAYKLVLRSC